MPLFLFIFIFSGTYIHSITFIQYVIQSPIAEVPLKLLIAGQLSEKKSLPGVPSREQNSLGPALHQADALPSKQHRTLTEQHHAQCWLFRQTSFFSEFRSVSFRSETRNELFRDKRISSKEALFPPRNNEIRSEPIRGIFSEQNFDGNPTIRQLFFPFSKPVIFTLFACSRPASSAASAQSQPFFYRGFSR